jgi:phosphoribosyl 1,2-cyclic phosphodiesterase
MLSLTLSHSLSLSLSHTHFLSRLVVSRRQRSLHPEIAGEFERYAEAFPPHVDDSRNVRGNVQLALRIPHADGRPRVVVIDCGKTARDAFHKYFARHNITYVDCFLLTHDHADAMLGLDDVRDIPSHNQSMDLPSEADKDRVGKAVVMPIYCMDRHFECIRTAFPYLCKGLVKTLSHVPNIDWRLFAADDAAIDFDGLAIELLPVWHGEGYTCMGFAFGGGATAAAAGGERLVYLSDVSSIPEKTWDRILAAPTDVLVLDCLRRSPSHPTHVTLDQSLDIVRRIRPRGRTLLVGMLCVMEHTESNAALAALKESEGLDVQLAFDGQFFQMNLY